MTTNVHDWCDPTVFGRNKEAARATAIPYENEQDALAAFASPVVDRESPYRLSLDGAWRFSLATSPAQAPDGFEAADFDDSEWDELAVPSNWQLAGEQIRQGIAKYDVPNVHQCPVSVSHRQPARRARG